MQRILIGTALAVGAGITLGCAGARVNLAQGGALRVERADTPKASVTQAYLYREEDGQILVSGKVKRDAGYAMTLSGHVDVAVYDPQGGLLQQASVPYTPGDLQRFRSQRRSGASFSARLPSVPPHGSTVRVAFHETRVVGPPPAADCGANEAARSKPGT